jgi:molecular chaperone DnaK
MGTDGNHLLGGKDWDAVIAKYVCEQFLEEFGVDPRDDETAKNELIVASENYKKVLTKADSVTAQIRFDGNSGKYTMTREQFDVRTEFLLNATRDVCAKLINDLGTSWNNIDEILLVGGSTRMPQVTRFLENITGKKVVAHSDTDLAVAKGAAITAELYCSENTGLREVQIKDVTAHSLGALSMSPDGKKYVNEIMIARNSKVPATVKKSFKIKEGNLTDRIEVYTLQGESRVPLDCYILAKVVVTGFSNDGNGTQIDIEYKYDENGVVSVSAFQDGYPLQVDPEPVPADVEWMNEPPAASTSGPVAKNVVVCVDLSRSMRNSMDDVKSAISDFVTGLADSTTRFGLVGFGDKIGIIRDMTPDHNTIISALSDLKVNVYGRGTDASPLGTALTMLSGRPGAKMILVLTDGIWGKRDFAVSEAITCRNAKTAVVAVGFADADFAFLKQIATVEEGAIYTTLNRLGDTFSTIATAINAGSMGLRESVEVKARLR